LVRRKGGRKEGRKEGYKEHLSLLGHTNETEPVSEKENLPG
jgi:hypothetical protein